jgi:hypothetical protein
MRNCLDEVSIQLNKFSDGLSSRSTCVPPQFSDGLSSRSTCVPPHISLIFNTRENNFELTGQRKTKHLSCDQQILCENRKVSRQVDKVAVINMYFVVHIHKEIEYKTYL